MKSQRTEPPDGGYGWVVVTSAFFILGLTTGSLRNFGIFFLDIQNYFQVTNATTSWVMSLAFAMFHLGAPLATALSLRYSQRVVIIIGGLLATLGMALSFLDLSLFWLYLTVGFIQGMGVSFSWTAANSIVGHYFSRRLPMAYGITSAGDSLCSLLLSPFFQWLLEMYGWQGSFLIIGGLQLNICVCGALMRPLEVAQSSLQEKADGQESNPAVLPQKRKVHFQFSLVKNPAFFLYLLFAVFSAVGIFIPQTFLVPFACSLGVDRYWPAFILSVLSFSDLVGRLVCGWIANMRLVRTLQLFPVVVFLKGLMLVLLPVSHNYWATTVFSGLSGFLLGCLVAIQLTTIIEILSLEGFDSGLGLFMLVRSIGCFGGPLCAGLLVDVTGNYGAPFYFAGVSLILAACDRLVQKTKAVQPDGHQAVNQEDRVL